MNAFEIKIFLLKHGLTITDIAKSVMDDFGQTFDSTRNALTQMFYHDKYNPNLARTVREKYGIKVNPPKTPQTVREAVRRAA